MNNPKNHRLVVVLLVIIALSLVVIAFSVLSNKMIDVDDIEDSASEIEEVEDVEDIEGMKEEATLELDEPFSANIININKTEVKIEIINNGNREYLLERVALEKCGTVVTAQPLKVSESSVFSLPCVLEDDFYKTLVVRYSEGPTEDTLSITGILKGSF